MSTGFGILKFRLYDIDRIISRTVAYAVITGALPGTYVAPRCCWPLRWTGAGG